MATIPESAMRDALQDLNGPRRRPTPIEWLRYAVLARAPHRCRTWVLHDVTAGTWVLRHAARTAVLLAVPALLVLLLAPVPFSYRLLIVANAGAPSFLGGMLFVQPAAERRLIHVGYPGELGEAIRHNRAVQKQNTSNRARRERIAARQARRRGTA